MCTTGRDSRQDSQINQGSLCTVTLSAEFVHPNLRVPGSLTIESGVQQGCVLASDSFTTGVDWLMERTVDIGINGVSFGAHTYSYLDITDYVAQKWPNFETVASLGLELNWLKTKVQALGSREDEPSTVTVLGQEVAIVEEFVNLGSLVHSTTQSSPDISRSQCHHPCGYAESRQPDLEIKNRNFNEAGVV